MRSLEKQMVISFQETAMAMLMEQSCKEDGMSGRLIPLPPAISAGCGLAWMTAIKDSRSWVLYMKNKQIIFDKIQEIEI